ncbi:unknown protein [Seminavis robusta]|uniref:CRESS-DNA virus Rep endonuclease domain-containing protein n=1 Tax=Seminavis robusta TaxID=568900 RepID=A0A9N8H459_9STRA|nr:unknown protein [Seminavis robusta]|eukprot:Sro42_g025380.1 n/a (186) ;mRNA; f:8757-9314
MPNGYRHWAFTCNNYSDEDKASIEKAASSSRVDYIIYGHEVASTGTPYLQGHMSLNKQTSMKKTLKLLGIQAHMTSVRNLKHSIEYCKKEDVWVHYGTPPSLTASGSSSGVRNDLNCFKEAVKSGTLDKKKLREEHSKVAAKYNRFFKDYIEDKTMKRGVTGASQVSLNTTQYLSRFADWAAKAE